MVSKNRVMVYSVIRLFPIAGRVGWKRRRGVRQQQREDELGSPLLRLSREKGPGPAGSGAAAGAGGMLLRSQVYMGEEHRREE